jgi:hypothetical protein
MPPVRGLSFVYKYPRRCEEFRPIDWITRRTKVQGKQACWDEKRGASFGR